MSHHSRGQTIPLSFPAPGRKEKAVPDDELYRRWQVALTEPLHRLQIRSAPKADFNHEVCRS